MRRFLFIAVGLLGMSLANTAQAQFAGGFDDPFFLYYGFFVPQQNLYASTPRQEDLLRGMAIQRQLNAQTEQARPRDLAAAGVEAAYAQGYRGGQASFTSYLVTNPRNANAPGQGNGRTGMASQYYATRRPGQMAVQQGGSVPTGMPQGRGGRSPGSGAGVSQRRSPGIGGGIGGGMGGLSGGMTSGMNPTAVMRGGGGFR